MKILIVSVLVLTFCLSVLGQSSHSPNELPGYQFFGKGRLQGLQLLVSSKGEVKRIFGEHCEKQCDYDAEWLVNFEYFESIWIKESSTNNGEKQTYSLDPKYLGTLRAIALRPKHRVSFLNISFPSSFERTIVTSNTDAHGGKSRMTVNDAYHDANGLTYEIYSRTNYDDIKNKETRQYEKGDLVLIRYNLTKEKEKVLFVLQS